MCVIFFVDIRKRQSRRKLATQSHGSNVSVIDHDRQAAEDYNEALFLAPGYFKPGVFKSDG